MLKGLQKCKQILEPRKVETGFGHALISLVLINIPTPAEGADAPHVPCRRLWPDARVRSNARNARLVVIS